MPIRTWQSAETPLLLLHLAAHRSLTVNNSLHPESRGFANGEQEELRMQEAPTLRELVGAGWKTG